MKAFSFIASFIIALLLLALLSSLLNFDLNKTTGGARNPYHFVVVIFVGAVTFGLQPILYRTLSKSGKKKPEKKE